MDSGECLIIFGTKPLIMKLRIIARKLFKYFLQGLIILAPITITFWAVLSLFNWVDSILPDFIHRLFPRQQPASGPFAGTHTRLGRSRVEI